MLDQVTLVILKTQMLMITKSSKNTSCIKITEQFFVFFYQMSVKTDNKKSQKNIHAITLTQSSQNRLKIIIAVKNQKVNTETAQIFFLCSGKMTF